LQKSDLGGGADKPPRPWAAYVIRGVEELMYVSQSEASYFSAVEFRAANSAFF
jgi:hypothetical protein